MLPPCILSNNNYIIMSDIIVLNLLKELIKVDSVNPPGNEKLIAEILSEWLLTQSIIVNIHDLGNRRANLVAR